ncbi:MAG TPA: class I lanthipeptide [Candidatus Angelobacter sp.]|jgi:natural product precursor|nr:class I lanthipeptide [Candidatus Angelobacter sp.]
MKSKLNKLVLNQEVLRSLNDHELAKVAGGVITNSCNGTCHPITPCICAPTTGTGTGPDC